VKEPRKVPGEVAVVIPCYNGAATVAETLASVIGEPGVREIVAVDDGSTDETLAVLRRHEPAIRVISGPNAGVSAARNRGIALTSAPWLIFLDSDDLLLAGTVAERLAAVSEPERDVVICRWRELIDSGSGEAREADLREVDWALLAQDAELACATRVWATTAAILYPRRLVERVGGFRGDLPVIQDARLLFDAAAKGGRFRRLDATGALYRVHPASLSRRDPARFWLDVLRNGRQIEAHWREGGRLSPQRRAALGDIFDGAANALVRLGHPAAREARAARRRYLPGEPWKLRAGMAALNVLGGRAARTLFEAGGAVNRVVRQRGGAPRQDLRAAEAAP
jgi:glycosyltransferase involved in cell wall biosynthesis